MFFSETVASFAGIEPENQTLTSSVFYAIYATLHGHDMFTYSTIAAQKPSPISFTALCSKYCSERFATVRRKIF